MYEQNKKEYIITEKEFKEKLGIPKNEQIIEIFFISTKTDIKIRIM